MKKLWVSGRGRSIREGGFVKGDGNGGQAEVVGSGPESKMSGDEDTEYCLGRGGPHVEEGVVRGAVVYS